MEEKQKEAHENNFFGVMYKRCPERWISMWWKQKIGSKERKITKSFLVSQQAEAMQYALKMAEEGKDVYFGVGLREKDLGPYERGGYNDVICITSLWADIDIKSPVAHKKERLPETFDEVMEWLNSLPFPPTIIIFSGGGIHAYWLFSEPWYFADQEDRKKAQDLNRKLQAELIYQGKARDWDLDNTSDLARVLRVPGTTHYKDPKNPKKVTIQEYHPERRYTPEKIEEWLSQQKQNQGNTGGSQYSKRSDQAKEPEDNAGEVTLVVQNCHFMQHCQAKAESLPEPKWFAMVSNLARIPGGEKVIHQYSSPYPGYSVEETDAKITHCLENAGPHTCEYIRKELQFQGCPAEGCGVKAPAAMATSVVVKAKMILNEVYEMVKQNPSIIFNEDIITALATLKKRDNAEYGKAITKLKQAAGSSIRLKELDMAVHERLKRDVMENSTDAFDGLKYSFQNPHNWVVNEQGVHIFSKEGIETICPTPLTIAERLKNMEDHTEKVKLIFKRDNRWQNIIVERSSVFDRNKIVKLADFGLPVTSETGKDLVNYLFAVEAANEIPVMRCVNHLGWVGDKQFIPGDAEIELDLSSGSEELAQAFQPSGELQAWIELVQPLRKTPLGRLVLVGGFAAPLVERLKSRTFALHVWGNSRASKSAAAKAALSVWGNPKEGRMTFNTTPVGIERQLNFLKNLPLLIDEKQIVAGKENSFVEMLVYMLGEGKGKTRGNKEGGLAAQTSWNTVAITTGEHPLSSDNSTTGVKTRTLEINCKAIVPETYGKTLHQQLLTQHGTAGPEFIRKLIEYPESNAIYEEILTKLQEQAPDLMSSHQEALAILATADILAGQWIFHESEDHALRKCWEMLHTAVKLLETKEEVDEAMRAMLHFQSWVQEHVRRFQSESFYEYGWQEDDDASTIFINSGTFSKAMQEGGFNSTRVKSDFREREWLIPYAKTDGTIADYRSKRNPLGKNMNILEIRSPLFL